MQLLNIKIPPLTRIQFANLESEKIWGEKINKASNLFYELEFLTVKHKVRKCMIAHNIYPNDLDVYMRDLARQGLIFVPLSKEQVDENNSFSHVSKNYNGQGAYAYRAVISSSIEAANEFVEAHHNNDDIKIGELLGFPHCCSKFFDEAWKKGYYDPIWQQAENTTSPQIVKNRRNFESPDGNIEKKLIRLKAQDDNYKILSTFRYIGIRLISHFACSFDCKESVKVANEWIALARELNLKGLDEALEILQLPFEWDCYKGYAIINTPVFKIVTDSMTCYPNHIIQQESDFYPEEAPTGIQFPWKFAWNKTTCSN